MFDFGNYIIDFVSSLLFVRDLGIQFFFIALTFPLIYFGAYKVYYFLLKPHFSPYKDFYLIKKSSRVSFNGLLLTMPAKRSTLSVDVPSLFSLFCSQKIKSKDVRLDIYDFSNRKIVSKEAAIENKNPIFTSFFLYIERIKTEAKYYGQYFVRYFVHSMTFLPG